MYLCSRRSRERSGVSGSWTPPRDWKWKGNETYNVADNVARTSTATSPTVAALVEYSYSISLNPGPPFPPSPFVFPSFGPTVVKNHRLSAPFLTAHPSWPSLSSPSVSFLCPHLFALSTPFDKETINASVVMRFVQKKFAKKSSCSIKLTFNCVWGN